MITRLIIIPVIVGITAQILKLVTDGIKGNLNFKTILITYGGLPSVHTALIVSLTTIIGKIQGVSSPVFSLSVVLSILIIRDALGLRRIVEEHSSYINRLTKQNKTNLPKLPIHFGHTALEITGGIAYGIIATLFLNNLF